MAQVESKSNILTYSDNFFRYSPQDTITSLISYDDINSSDTTYVTSVTGGSEISYFSNEYTDSNTTYSNSNYFVKSSFSILDVAKPLSVSEKLQEIIRSRQAPNIIRGESGIWTPDRNPLGVAKDVREVRARETLHSLIGDQKFRHFLKHGFVSVQNKVSRRVYQIYPGHGLTHVYENGKYIERLCVVLSGNFPPTDSVIVRYLMVINNEEQLWSLSNKHGVYVAKGAKVIDSRPLTEIFRDLKGTKEEKVNKSESVVAVAA